MVNPALPLKPAKRVHTSTLSPSSASPANLTVRAVVMTRLVTPVKQDSVKGLT